MLPSTTTSKEMSNGSVNMNMSVASKLSVVNKKRLSMFQTQTDSLREL